MMKKIFIGIGIVLLAIILILSIYRVSFNSDGYNIRLISRLSGFGYGIGCDGKFEIWEIGKTVHGGIAEKPLYYSGKWWL
jgi:hypothetical protein